MFISFRFILGLTVLFFYCKEHTRKTFCSNFKTTQPRWSSWLWTYTNMISQHHFFPASPTNQSQESENIEAINTSSKDLYVATLGIVLITIVKQYNGIISNSSWPDHLDPTTNLLTLLFGVVYHNSSKNASLGTYKMRSLGTKQHCNPVDATMLLLDLRARQAGRINTFQL